MAWPNRPERVKTCKSDFRFLTNSYVVPYTFGASVISACQVVFMADIPLGLGWCIRTREESSTRAVLRVLFSLFESRKGFVFVSWFLELASSLLSLFIFPNIKYFLFLNSFQIFFFMPMGVLAPGYVHTRPVAQPPSTWAENISAHVSAKSPSNIFPNP